MCRDVNIRRYIVGFIILLGVSFMLLGCFTQWQFGAASLGALVFIAIFLWWWAVEQDVRVDTAERIIDWEWRLFGRFPFWTRRHSFDEFRAVEVWRRSGESDSANEDIRVYLLSVTGKYLMVHHFSVERGKPCFQAGRAARNLAGTINLEFHNHDPVTQESAPAES
jgi:hypothetical protein